MIKQDIVMIAFQQSIIAHWRLVSECWHGIMMTCCCFAIKDTWKCTGNDHNTQMNLYKSINDKITFRLREDLSSSKDEKEFVEKERDSLKKQLENSAGDKLDSIYEAQVKEVCVSLEYIRRMWWMKYLQKGLREFCYYNGSIPTTSARNRMQNSQSINWAFNAINYRL